MTFILTRLGPFEGKVHDPDRNIELVSLGGGSDLRLSFRLVGKFDQYEFRGRTTGHSKPSESQVAQGIENVTNWEIGATDRPFRIGPNPDDKIPVRRLIVEAMRQYGFAANKKETDFVSVRFLSAKGVVE